MSGGLSLCSCSFETFDTASSSIAGGTEGCCSSSLCASHEPKIWEERGDRTGKDGSEKREGKEE